MPKTINTFAGILETRATHKKNIETLTADFTVTEQISKRLITEDIIFNVINAKFEEIKKQFSNEVIKNATDLRDNGLKTIATESKEFHIELSSILAMVSSSLGQKKPVVDITLASSSALEDDKLIAHVGNSSTYQITLTSNDDVELAKRYLAINKLLAESNKQEIEIIKVFKEAVKGTSYEEVSFQPVYDELNRISDLDIWNLNNLLDVDYFLYEGNDGSHDKYKVKLEELKEAYKVIKKEYGVNL